MFNFSLPLMRAHFSAQTKKANKFMVIGAQGKLGSHIADVLSGRYGPQNVNRVSNSSSGEVM
jgi:hypothetical protein